MHARYSSASAISAPEMPPDRISSTKIVSSIGHRTTRQLIVRAAGVTEPAVGLQTRKLTLLAVAQACVICVAVGAAIAALNAHSIASVVAAPVAAVVTRVAQANVAIRLVPSAEVPETIVWLVASVVAAKPVPTQPVPVSVHVAESEQQHSDVYEPPADVHAPGDGSSVMTWHSPVPAVAVVGRYPCRGNANFLPVMSPAD